MNKAYDFLKDCGFYYLLTIDNGFPTGRPISQILEADGVMYFGTHSKKEFYRQLSENKNVGLIAFNKGRWLRLIAEVSETHDAEIRENYLKRIPAEIKRFGSSTNPELAVFAMKIVRADLHTGDNSEDITEESR